MSETTDRLDRIEADVKRLLSLVEQLMAAVEAALKLLNPAARLKLAAAGIADRFTKGATHADPEAEG